ncbi:MAG: S8 family serine peptidase [Fusicatenibacter sp.]
MKKKIKKAVIALVLVLLLFAGFLVMWVWFIFPHVYPSQSEEGNAPIGHVEIAEKSETIDFDEETGMLYVNNEIVVLIREAASEEEIGEFLKGYDAEIDDSMADIGIYKLTFPEAMEYETLTDLVKEMKASPVAEDAYLNLVTELEEDTYHTDDDFDYQDAVYPTDDWNGDTWNVNVPGGENWGMEAIDAPGAWGYLDQLSDVKIGLIDTMPNTSHSDLSFANTSCLFVDESTGKTTENKYTLSAEDHGTHVSGIMAADWNNNVGVAGVTGGKGQLYYAEVYYESNGSIFKNYATAYAYLLSLKKLIDQDVQAINISQNTSRLVGFAASHGNQNAVDYLTLQANLAEKGLARIISAREDAGKSDFVICVAAGNSNSTYYYKDDSAAYGYREEMTWWEKIKYLFGWRGEIGDSFALYNNFLNLMDEESVKDRVIVVGAIGIDSSNSTPQETRYSYASFSNVGSRVNVAAPGYDVYSCNANGYQLMSGTSMACPHVTGVAGLVFAANPSLTGPEVKTILTSSTMGRYYYTGGYSGLINANTAVVNALKTKDTTVGRVLKTETQSGLDLCFVIDTTGSMGDDIENAKENMTDILEHLAEKTSDFRVAIIDYRDFSSRSDYSADYPYKIQLPFTDSEDAILDAIDSLDLGNGGDEEETVYSALMAAVGLNWRDTAQRVIIILGDAAPLDPEPNTNYTYDEVLLALFNAKISVDYEDSDERVVGDFEDSLINVFSIGTDASTGAADFFENISVSTGGAYAGVDDASRVSDAIIDSIEQIEVIQKVHTNLDFGDSLANQEIEIYSGEEYLFSIQTDENGEVSLNEIEPETYQWKCNHVYAGGTIFVEANGADSSVRTTRVYGFAKQYAFIENHKALTAISIILFFAVCVLIPDAIKRVKTALLNRRGKKQREKSRMKCIHCGENIKDDAKFCSKCGQKIPRCPECGFLITKRTIRYCPKDGTPIPEEIRNIIPENSAEIKPVLQMEAVADSISGETEEQEQSPLAARPTRKRSAVPILAALLGVLVLVACGLFAYIGISSGLFSSEKGEETHSASSKSETITDRTAVPESEEIEVTEGTKTAYESEAVEEKTETTVPELAEEEPSKESEKEEMEDPVLYFIMNCDHMYFTNSDLKDFDADMCRRARNGIYARLGRKFDDNTLTEYFSQFDWYIPTISPDDFSEDLLNTYQVSNRDLIVAYEKEKGYQ